MVETIKYKCLSCGIHKESSSFAKSNNVGQIIESKCKYCRNERKKACNSYNPLRIVWGNMIDRCYNKNCKAFYRYGGRGISVCNNWRYSFTEFKEWAEANGWRKGIQIDRMDNDGDYEESNCRFVTPAVNCRNRSSTKLNWTKVNYIRNCVGKSTDELASELNVSKTTIINVKDNFTWKE